MPFRLQVLRALENVDRIVGMLMDGLTQRDLHHCANIMVVSDHGEATTRPARGALCHFTCWFGLFLWASGDHVYSRVINTNH